jgi:hypothetical protein
LSGAWLLTALPACVDGDGSLTSDELGDAISSGIADAVSNLVEAAVLTLFL